MICTFFKSRFISFLVFWVLICKLGKVLLHGFKTYKKGQNSHETASLTKMDKGLETKMQGWQGKMSSSD